MATSLTAHGVPLRIDDAHFGELDDSSALAGDGARLRETMDRQGYVFLRGLLEPDLVMKARAEILVKYAILGEIDDRHPVTDAIAGSRAGLRGANMRAFTESVRTGACYEAVVLHDRLLATVGLLLDAEAEIFGFRWPRLVRPGESCGFHCDGPYMNRGTSRQLSAWIPLGPVEPHEGGLIILEDSHTNPELRAGYLTMDADRDGLEWLDDDPGEIQDRYGRRWLTASFRPGDVLLFSMNTLHGALDNRSPEQRCRLSTDSRYYARGDTPDPRWNGADVQPHGPGRVFYPGLGSWSNADFQDEWKYVDEHGRLRLAPEPTDRPDE